ncbi:hypothetical protein OKW43_004638 [Paraburkholderia sp. WC7.3g]
MQRKFDDLLLGSIELFCLAAELGSFTLAANAASVMPAAVSRSVARLEERLGVRLFVRTTRREVDDALVTYDAEQRRRDRLTTAVSMNERALAVARERYEAGALDYLDVLNVQRQLLEAQSNLQKSKGGGEGSSRASSASFCRTDMVGSFERDVERAKLITRLMCGYPH